MKRTDLGDIAAIVFATILIFGLALWALNVATDPARHGETHSVVNEDSPGESLPPCTDEIAENGGLCQGPLVEEVNG